MVILDALAALCAQKKPSFVAIGLRLTKPIELLVATNDKSLPNAVVSQLNTICKIVKKISDHKYNYGFPSVDINKSSLPSSYDNAEEEEFYENLLFQIYSYSWENITPQTLQELGCNPKCNSTRDREGRFIPSSRSHPFSICIITLNADYVFFSKRKNHTGYHTAVPSFAMARNNR